MTDIQNDIKKRIKSLFLLSLFIIFVYGVNFAVDPANIFNTKYADRAAKIMASGQNVTNLQNMDDRQLIKKYAEITKEDISTLVIGSSRSMQYTNDVTGDENSFCAGVTGADIRDNISAYMIFKENGHQPKKVVFCAEYWFLSPSNLDNRALTEEYDRFCRLTGNEPFRTTSRRKAMIHEIFSFSYFQSSVKYLLTKRDMPDLEATDSPDNLYPTRRSDGTYSYEQAYRTRSERTVTKEVTETNHGNSIANSFTHVHEGLKKQLEDFIVMMQEDGVQVVIQLSPFHPEFYSYMTTHDSFDEILSTEDYFYSLEDKYGIEVCGSYNPNIFNMTGADFYDSQHPSAEGAYKYYGIKRS